jgi:hypothetical protein
MDKKKRLTKEKAIERNNCGRATGKMKKERKVKDGEQMAHIPQCGFRTN